MGTNTYVFTVLIWCGNRYSRTGENMCGNIIIGGNVSNSIIQQDTHDCEAHVEQAAELLTEIRNLIALEANSEYRSQIVFQLDNLEKLIQQNANPSIIRRCFNEVKQLSMNVTSSVVASKIIEAIREAML